MPDDLAPDAAVEIRPPERYASADEICHYALARVIEEAKRAKVGLEEAREQLEIAELLNHEAVTAERALRALVEAGEMYRFGSAAPRWGDDAEPWLDAMPFGLHCEADFPAVETRQEASKAVETRQEPPPTVEAPEEDKPKESEAASCPASAPSPGPSAKAAPGIRADGRPDLRERGHARVEAIKASVFEALSLLWISAPPGQRVVAADVIKATEATSDQVYAALRTLVAEGRIHTVREPLRPGDNRLVNRLLPAPPAVLKVAASPRLADLRDGQCRWPLDDPGPGKMHDTAYCGAPAAGDYCARHEAMARPPKKEKR